MTSSNETCSHKCVVHLVFPERNWTNCCSFTTTTSRTCRQAYGRSMLAIYKGENGFIGFIASSKRQEKLGAEHCKNTPTHSWRELTACRGQVLKTFVRL